MKLQRVLSHVGIALFLGASAALAANTTPTVTPAPGGGAQTSFHYTQVMLTPAIIQNFIKTYAVVQQKTAAVGAKYNVKVDKNSANGDFSAYATNAAALAEMNAAVTPYGYKDIFDWTNTTMTILFSAQWAMMGPQLDAQLAQMQNPGGATKAAALGGAYAAAAAQLQQAQQAAAQMAANKPSQANIDAAKPYASQLMALMAN